MVDRYEVDHKYKIVDFYIEDEAGREYHSGMTFYQALQFAKELINQIQKTNTNKNAKPSPQNV